MVIAVQNFVHVVFHWIMHVVAKVSWLSNSTVTDSLWQDGVYHKKQSYKMMLQAPHPRNFFRPCKLSFASVSLLVYMQASGTF